jgi:hypothetical protein
MTKQCGLVAQQLRAKPTTTKQQGVLADRGRSLEEYGTRTRWWSKEWAGIELKMKRRANK